jgi:hypothetical protein
MGSVFVTKSREPDPEETDNQYSYAQITFGGAYFFLYPAILRLRDQTGELIDPQTCAFFDGTILDELERFLNESRQRVLAEPNDWNSVWARRSRAVNRSTNARLKPRCSSFWINYIAQSCSLVNRASVCSSWVMRPTRRVCHPTVTATDERRRRTGADLEWRRAPLAAPRRGVRFRDESAEVSVREEAAAYANLTRASRTIW